MYKDVMKNWKERKPVSEKPLTEEEKIDPRTKTVIGNYRSRKDPASYLFNLDSRDE